MMRNAAQFAGNIKGFQRRLNYAVKAQTKKVEAQVERYELEMAKKSGLRTN